ncbi:glutathione S-transferase [Maricaulis sp.]|uniref:glutathione S-transferase n=1 Tax=Maricaulis sp. TaxID=1486257 RepID=UPI001B09A18E|nr:glutathione S-transferase [Maricaulis sp.]MBO6798087.1 glutathione S-transferase [Maricaulis sp.]
MTLPILYSFRRCPYAMRARLALDVAGIELEHREILLKDKPPEMLEASPKGTVPVLVLPDGHVVDESLDVMLWALGQNDPENWLDELDTARPLIEANDGPFKHALDRYKYPNRYENVDPAEQREIGVSILLELEHRLARQEQLCGDIPGIADAAICPFVRQYAHTDRDWFATTPLPHVRRWLDGHLESELFARIMRKHEVWRVSS